jgi:hypothetical protein
MKGLIDCGIAWDSVFHSGLERKLRELTDMVTSRHANKRTTYISGLQLSVTEAQHLKGAVGTIVGSCIVVECTCGGFERERASGRVMRIG